MASSPAAASSRPTARRRRGRGRPAPWWGEGPPPHERWPGVTIEIRAVWSKKRERWESPDGRYYFDEAAADKACDFFPTFLSHHIGEHAGQPFELLDYQRALIIRPIFGWKRATTGLRRFRFLFAFLPKGNGKSPLGSGIGLYLALCDDEPAAEVYAVAGDKDQAKVVHETAKVMVEESADLLELCQVLRDSIYCPKGRQSYKVLSADAPGKHGKRPHGVILDELHNQPNRDLFEALRKSLLKRRQPLFVMLSHAGDDDESICYEEYEYSKRLLSGTGSDESYLPVIFEAGPKDDWTKRRNWEKANPGFGITINPEIFEAECRAAQEEPRKRNDFLRFNLNRWVGQAVAWLPIEWWDERCAAELQDGHLQQLRCAAGLDMAQKIDFASFVIDFIEFLERGGEEIEVVTGEEGQAREVVSLSLNYRIYSRAWYWLPEDTLREREKESGLPLTLWREQGHLVATSGGSIDYDRVYRDITQKIAPRFPLLKQGEIGYDPAFATDIANRLRDRGGFTTVEVLQNYKHFSEPSQVFEALVKSGRWQHDGHPILRWNVENVAVKRDDAGRIRPVKPRRASKRIDGVVAAIMGLSRLMVQPERKRSRYEDDDPRVLDLEELQRREEERARGGQGARP